MSSIPFPSNNRTAANLNHSGTDKLAWKTLHPNEHTPMSFEVRGRNGLAVTFPYSDFRGTKLLHAGYLIVNIYGMEKYQIIVEGRNLGELAKHLSLGRIHWFGESQVLEHELPETTGHIDTIRIQELTGHGHAE